MRGLVSLADTAAAQADASLASTVLNQSALLASDVGDPHLARDLCHQHAVAYLHACPQPWTTVIRALEPVVNLARLLIRAGRPDEARRHLLDLYEAVTSGAAARIENIDVPAALTATAEDQHEVRAWLWRVLLADGTRALTTAGRWADALYHLREHRGIGKRMLDGRQVAVLAALTSGDTADAAALLADTAPGEPWEQAVTATLNQLCRQALGQPAGDHFNDLVTIFERLPAEGMTVFHTRLGLTILDMLGPAVPAAAHRISRHLHRRTTEATDGYAARDCLANESFTAFARPEWTRAYNELIQNCALGAKVIPEPYVTDLMNAVRSSDRVIRQNLRAAQRG